MSTHLHEELGARVVIVDAVVDGSVEPKFLPAGSSPPQNPIRRDLLLSSALTVPHPREGRASPASPLPSLRPPPPSASTTAFSCASSRSKARGSSTSHALGSLLLERGFRHSG